MAAHCTRGHVTRHLARAGARGHTPSIVMLPAPPLHRLDEVMAEDVKELYRKEERLKQVRARRPASTRTG